MHLAREQVKLCHCCNSKIGSGTHTKFEPARPPPSPPPPPSRSEACFYVDFRRFGSPGDEMETRFD